MIGINNLPFLPPMAFCPSPLEMLPMECCPSPVDQFQSAAAPEMQWAMAQMGMLRSFAETQQKGYAHIAPKDLRSYMTPSAKKIDYHPGAAVKFARSLEGERSDEVHLKSGVFWNPADFHAAGDNLNDRNCADFVSGLLQKGGGLSRHRSSVPQLEMQLEHDGWSRRPEGAAPNPGDVWISNKRGHVEMVDHVDRRGQVYTIGANNRRDVSGPGQWISVHAKKEGSGFYLTPPAK